VLKSCVNWVVFSACLLSTFPTHTSIYIFNAVELQRFEAYRVLIMPVYWGVSVALLLLDTVDLIIIARLEKLSFIAVFRGKHNVTRRCTSKSKAEK